MIQKYGYTCEATADVFIWLLDFCSRKPTQHSRVLSGHRGYCPPRSEESLCVKVRFLGVCPSHSAGPGTVADSGREKAGSKPWLEGAKICGHGD